MTIQTSKSPAQGFDFGLDIQFQRRPLNFHYGAGVFGPKPEYRSLDAIRASLQNPNSTGPDPVYAIAMDVGRVEDRDELSRRMLLFGIVIYAGGKLGDEPVRSQGHVHAIAPHCGWSTPELFEIWEGRAIVYAQQNSGDDPGLCIAIAANADPSSVLIFGAWCDRQYGFDYTQMRAHHGLAWYPVVASNAEIVWRPNPAYASSALESRKARTYPELGLSPTMPIYEHFRHNPESVQWVSDPGRLAKLWGRFEP